MDVPTSDWTPHKEEFFRRASEAYAATVAMIQRKYPSWGPLFDFDLTAGTGWLQANGGVIKGSPLIALEVFRKTPRLAVQCLFVEQNPAYAQTLSTAIQEQIKNWSVIDRSRIKVELKAVDHRSILRDFALAPHGSLGLLYWDGLGADIYPSLLLRYWLTEHPKHDLLIMGSATAQKRTSRPRFDRMLLTVPRDHVWVSEPNGSWGWIFAIGTNWEPLPKKFSDAGIKLYPAFSEAGKAIRDTLGLTKSQRRTNHGQIPLWSEYSSYEQYLRHPNYLAVRAEALKRANGLCECCGKPASEVHHLRYPPWGEFDIVENLLAICHQCHCWIEGKQS
jgi:hypothetical protein